MMLTWSLYQLTQNPRCLAKVREEARGVFKGEWRAA
jgi:cytochrome P450